MSNKVYFFCIFIVYFLSVSCNENDSCYYRDISLRNFNYINSGIDTSKALYFFKKEINGFTYEYDMTGENIHKRRIPFVKFDSSVQYYLHKETTERYSNFVLLIAEPSDYSIYHFNIINSHSINCWV